MTRSALYITHAQLFFFLSRGAVRPLGKHFPHSPLCDSCAFDTQREPLKCAQHRYQERPQFNVHRLQKSPPFHPTQGNGHNNSQIESYQVPGSYVPTCTADTSIPSIAAFTRWVRLFSFSGLMRLCRKARSTAYTPPLLVQLTPPKLYTSRTRSSVTCQSRSRTPPTITHARIPGVHKR